MYKIIGGDGREYGPVDAAQIQQWVLEGRADRFTRIQGEDGTWKALSDFPEFASILAQRSQSTPPPPLAYASPVDFQQAILQREAQLDIGDCLSRGWSLFAGNFGLLFVAVLILWLVQQLGFIPLLGALVYLVLAGPLIGGISVIYLKRIRGEPAAIKDMFSLFGTSFLPLMLVNILTIVLSTLGFLFCFLPGLYLKVAWVFSIAVAADRQLDFWSAMELSRRVVSRKWFKVLLLMFIAFLPLVLFQSYLTMEMFQAIWPVMSEGMKSGKPDMKEVEAIVSSFAPMAFTYQIVYLFTLPFASAVLMQAYEALFGSRKTPGA